MTHYEVLGVAATASAAEIKRAYREMARRHHPDVGGGDDMMERLNRAWATLSDPARRRAYDNVLGVGAANSATRRPAPPPPPPIVVDEEGEADWGPEPEPGPPSKRDILLLVPVGLLFCAAGSVGVGALLYAPVFLGLAIFFLAAALFSFALVPIMTLRRQARRTYRS